MESKKRITKLWIIITSLLLVLSIGLIMLSLITYPTVIKYLSRFQPDGSFDSLSRTSYTTIIWIIRIKAVILGAAGLFSLTNRKRSVDLLDGLYRTISNISIREDLSYHFQSVFGKDDRWFLAALGVITITGLLIRLIQIDRTVDYDEAYTFIHFASRSFRYIITDYSAPNNHVFHSMLVYAAYHIFGNHLWALRLPALLAGVLTIPAAYMAARVLYGRNAALTASVLVALTPMLIDFSDNGRGYTLLCLFSCLILWAAALLRERTTFCGWIMLAVFSVLGFYTVPVMVYPVATVFLWLLLSWFLKDTGGSRSKFIIEFVATSVLTIFVTLSLYSPILLLGTGLTSITGNDFVKSQGWSDFIQSVAGRIPRVWEVWNWMVPSILSILSVVGFVLLVILGWKRYSHKIPVWLAAVLGIGVLLVVQRVSPWPRVWLFLLVYYLTWSAAGWVALVEFLFARKTWGGFRMFFLSLAVLAVIIGLIAFKNDPTFSSPEKTITKNIAGFIADHITDEDTLVAVSPFTIQVGYYLQMDGVPFERFYDRARKEPIKHAFLIVAERSKFPTIQSVVDFQELQNVLDIQKAVVIYQYKRILVYDVPVLN